jgi:nicotinate dehydrogenase subunit B
MAEAGIHRNLEPIYAFPRKRLHKHFVAEGPLRTSSTRSLGAFANVFAIESFMDELAHAAGRDPIEFRLAHLHDQRAREVSELLQARTPQPLSGENCGRGVAIARYKNQQTYAAVMVDLQVQANGSILLQRAYIAADAGLAIDPDGLCNQLEGGFIQAASWSLKEQVSWDAGGISSRDWDSYPILTFREIPEVQTFLVERSAKPPMGAGEASTGPTPGAIANAIFDAVGVRARAVPFTPERLRTAAAR